MANPVIAKGEKGGFKYVFRRYWLDIESVSGNFKFRSTAAEHPYLYLLKSIEQGNEDNVFGFAERVYLLQSTLTRDAAFVKDIDKAFKKLDKRFSEVELESDDAESASISEAKKVQEYVDATPKERKKMEKDTDKRLKKALKEAEKNG